MAYYLYNDNGDITFNLNAWPLLLELSFHYGWTRMGTQLNSVEKWDGSYLNMNKAYVKPEDALNLATALEKALPDIPDVDDDIIESVWGTNQIKVHNQTTEERLNEMSKFLNPPRVQDKGKLLLRFGSSYAMQAEFLMLGHPCKLAPHYYCASFP